MNEAILSNIHLLSQRSSELKDLAAEPPPFDSLSLS